MYKVRNNFCPSDIVDSKYNYNNLNDLCNNEIKNISNCSNVITSNKHFLNPNFIEFFKIIEDSNRINLNPFIWGDHAWVFLFSCADSYPKNPTNYDKKNMKIFLSSLKYALPCAKCRKNFSKEYENIDDEVLSCNSNLKLWLKKLKDKISKRNKENNKKYSCSH